jgi:hypothetical protein
LSTRSRLRVAKIVWIRSRFEAKASYRAYFTKSKKGDSEDRATYGRMEFGRNFGRNPFEWWLPVRVPWRLTVSKWHLEGLPELTGLKFDCQVF